MGSRDSKPFRFRLHPETGVPVYRQIMDQVHGAIAAGTIKAGDQLPTVRQLAVDLSVNPNTVIRAYRELEIRGIVDTQQGTGTFINRQEDKPHGDDRQKRLEQLAQEFAARAGAAGFSIREVLEQLQVVGNAGKKRR